MECGEVTGNPGPGTKHGIESGNLGAEVLYQKRPFPPLVPWLHSSPVSCAFEVRDLRF